MSEPAYGHWPSPISAELLTAQGVRLSEPQVVGETLYWLETRPQEKGRSVLVCQTQGDTWDVLPSTISVRTRIHEYGGGAYLATSDKVFYVADSDQRLYCFDIRTGTHHALTPEGDYRYADFCLDEQRQRLLAVREDCHLKSEHPLSSIIAIDLHSFAITTLAEGADFYSNPRLSPKGNQLSYLRWNHPAMPWDATECVLNDLADNGSIIHSRVIAGGAGESIFQPQWSPLGELFFVSDRGNWWNIYRWTGECAQCVCPMDAEFATPQWVFGMSTYGFLSAMDIFCCYTQGGSWQLGLINTLHQSFRAIEQPLRDISGIACHQGRAYFLGATATQGIQLWSYKNGQCAPLNDQTFQLDDGYLARARAIEFPTHDGETAHGFFYAPTHAGFRAPRDHLPPLLVMCHGGPTGATETSLNLKIQFWTSRGFAVLDVNYRGSTGYGRQYRDRLKGNWGIIDVIDVCSGVDYLATQGLIDKDKVAIRGSSAGGYTVLAALTFSEVFKAGASLYGIGDLEALARDTHKFEAHYLDSLVGTYPEEQHIYHERSPIHHVEKLNCPVIFLQGLQDKVVPPAQAEAMVAALQDKGIMTRYVTFAEEGHGFRQAANIQRALNEELAFYLTVLGDN